MEATKPIVQVILPRSDAAEDGQELSRPPSVFPVAEVDRLRAQEGRSGSGQGTIQNEVRIFQVEHFFRLVILSTT
jgi:hypothetical protein